MDALGIGPMMTFDDGIFYFFCFWRSCMQDIPWSSCTRVVSFYFSIDPLFGFSFFQVFSWRFPLLCFEVS
jgi:hypothetical protein